jgi:Ca-activated chloride channel family protein
MDSLRENAPEPEVRTAVVALALDHHLVTKYTSLVAVDRTPARPDAAALRSAAMPTNLPEGWTYEAVFGELPRGATDARLNLLVGALLLAAAMLAFGVRGRLES